MDVSSSAAAVSETGKTKKPRAKKEAKIKTEPVDGEQGSSAQIATPASPTDAPVPAVEKAARVKKEPKAKVKVEAVAEPPASDAAEEAAAPAKKGSKATAPKAPVYICQEVLKGGAKSGQICGCRAEAGSTDRCGRHRANKTSAAAAAGESGAVSVKPRRQNKTKGKAVNMQVNLGKHNAQWTVFVEAKFGYAIYPGTTIAFDHRLDSAVGSMDMTDGTIRRLDAAQIAFCRQKRIPMHAMPHSITAPPGVLSVDPSAGNEGEGPRPAGEGDAEDSEEEEEEEDDDAADD
jgi:hypothetical protein